MKRFLALLLVTVLLGSTLVGCQYSSSDSSDKSSGDTGTADTSTPAGSDTSDAAASDTKPTGEPILIGGVYPLTGDLADSGKNMQYGIQMALDEVNAAGGINGRPIEITYGDSKGAGATGMTEMERLITQEKVLAVIGAYQSSVTEVVSQVSETYKVPMITANATSDALTSHGYKYFFRLAPTNMMFIRDMIQFISEEDEKNDDMSIKTVAVCADNTEVGQQTVEWTKYWAKEHGYDYLGEVLYSQGAADLTSEVLQLKDMNPDALILDSYVSDAILLTKTFNEQGYAPKLAIAKGNGYTEASYLQSVENLANGITLATEYVPGSKGQNVSVEFEKKYGVAMNGHSAEAYTTTWVLATALQNIADAGLDITTETIKDELSKIKIDGQFANGNEIILPYDTIEFTTSEFNGSTYENQNMGGKLTVVQVQNGLYVPVWPFDITDSEFIYPAPLK